MRQSHPLEGIVFLALLGGIALVAIITGAVLAANDYSSAGAFSIAAACVGVLGTLTVQRVANGDHGHDE